MQREGEGVTRARKTLKSHVLWLTVAYLGLIGLMVRAWA